MLAIVVAHGSNRVIGVDGALPWHLPTDMAFFRDLTMGHPVIMGRKTYDSIPAKFRPLPGRRNLVLSRNPAYVPPDGAEAFGSFQEALVSAEGAGFVIGGGQTYADAMPFVDRVYATEVELAPDGDTFFAALDDGWALTEERERVVESDGSAFTIRIYDRHPQG